MTKPSSFSTDTDIVQLKKDELILLRKQIAQAKGTQKRELILNAKDPQEVVRSMHPQEFFVTIKDIGIQDCVEFLPLAKKSQIAFALDVDCWKKDTFQTDQLTEWLRFLPAQETEVAEAILKSMDSEVLIYYFKDFFNIYDRDENDAAPEVDGELIMTHDGFYYLEILFPPEDPRNILAHSILNLFEGYGFKFFHRFIEGMRYNLSSELQEIAFQFRKTRLEEYGFVDYYDAISLFQPLASDNKAFPISFAEDRIASLPDFYSAPTGSLFEKGYLKLPAEHQERLHYELLYLSNKFLSAEQIDISAIDSIKKTLKKMFDTIQIGMETLILGDSLQLAEKVLATNHVEWIFRKGFTEIAKTRSAARNILSNPLLTLIDKKASLLTLQQIQMVKACQNVFPLSRLPSEEGIIAQAQPFQALLEVQRCLKELKRIEFLGKLFFEYLGFSNAEARFISFRSPIHKDDVSFLHLFLTLIGNVLLQNKVSLNPLHSEQINPLLLRLFEKQEGINSIRPEVKKQMEEALLAYPFSPSERIKAKNFLQDTWDFLQEEAGSLDLERDVEKQFISLFLIR